MYYSALRALLFALSRKDAEIAHHMGIDILKYLSDSPRLLRLIEGWQSIGVGLEKPFTAHGITFPNRVGLAAGFDKHGEALRAIEAIGFGFSELGTFVPEPQEGNPRPRLFRYPAGRGLINRMGFNSCGLSEADKNLRGSTAKVRMPYGISLGKNKDTPNESAAGDYQRVAHGLRRYGQYLTANVSSPNTTGLRALQGAGIGKMVAEIIASERVHRAEIGLQPRPLLVKTAPDLEEEQLKFVVDEVLGAGAVGFVGSNTTLRRPRWLRDTYGWSAHAQQGGYSGPELFSGLDERVFYRNGWVDQKPLSTLDVASIIRKQAPKALIMSVGGIDRPEKALAALDVGADLVQIYTPFIYGGPPLVSRMRRRLAQHP